MDPPNVFISYSHADASWKDRLVSHLGVLEQEGRLAIWQDREILPGDALLPEIERAMDAAAVAVLLISADFLTSDFIRGTEVPRPAADPGASRRPRREGRHPRRRLLRLGHRLRLSRPEPWYDQRRRGRPMLKTIEGVFRQGRVELNETPGDVHDPTPVVVTFLEPRSIDLRANGIDDIQAADLRARLATFVEDWERPEMDVYDDYDGAKLRAR